MKLIFVFLLVGLVATVHGAPQETTHPPTTTTTVKTEHGKEMEKCKMDEKE